MDILTAQAPLAGDTALENLLTAQARGFVYGGLAAAIGLMAWMEISATLVFVGAAWNSESAARES